MYIGEVNVFEVSVNVNSIMPISSRVSKTQERITD